MGFKVKIGLILFLFIFASIVSSSSAGRTIKSMSKLAKEIGISNEESSTSYSDTEEEDDAIHGRLLRANTKDYGRYDPAPALVRPPFKLIPN